MLARWLKHPVFFIFVIFATYTVGVWNVSIPLTGDQKTYLSIALEMFEKKEWIIPTLFGQPNFLKPPFQYWATLIGWLTFGISVVGAILPSVLALTVSSFLTYEIGKKLKVVSPMVAAVLFAGCFGSMTYGSTAQMEVWIVLFFLAAWLAALHEQIFLSYIIAGVMAWVKGPLYPALYTFCILCWKPSLLKTKKFWGSLLFGALLGLSWYFLAATTQREQMIQQFFYTENFGKTGTHQGSMLGLWGEFIFSLFPWLVFLFLGIFQKQTREHWKLNRRFYFSFVGAPFVFFSLFPYHVNSYFYLFTPVAALLVSEVNVEFSSKTRPFFVGLYLVIFAAMSTLMVFLYRGDWIGLGTVIAAVVSFLVFLAGLSLGSWIPLAIGSLLIVNVIRCSAIGIGEQDVAGLRRYIQDHSSAPLAYYIDGRDIWHEYGLMSAVVGKSIQRIYPTTLNDHSDLDKFLAQGGAVIFQDDQSLELQKNLQCSDWVRLKRRTKFPITRLLQDGVRWGDAEMMRTYHICSRAAQT